MKSSTRTDATSGNAKKIDVEDMKEATPEVHIVSVGTGKTRQLLEDVSGYVPTGELTELIGESRADTTTLLNVLAERI